MIQQLGVSATLGYRLIVYDDEHKLQHSDFSSAVFLLGTLREALPELELSQQSLNPLREGQGSIVSDGELVAHR